MNPPQAAVVKYLADSLPYYGLLALGYFVLLAVLARAGVRANWKGNFEVAALAAFFHALTISGYYQYLNLPRLPLPATSLSPWQVFVITTIGLFVTLAGTNLVARLLAALLGFGSPRKPAGAAVSLAAVTRKRDADKDK